MISKLEMGEAMDDIKALIEGLLEDLGARDKKKINRKVNTKNLKANINIDLENKSDDYYLSKLRIRNANINLPDQVKKESINLYLNLIKIGLAGKKILSNDLYNQIYLLSRDYVNSFYDPNFEKKTQSIYENLGTFLDKDTIKTLKDTAKDFIKNIPRANEKTIAFYDLTANGKQKVFWDEDGSLREKYKFDIDQERAIESISKRSNILWDNEDLKNLTMNLFLKSLKIVFDDENINTDLLVAYQKPYTLSKKLLDSLLIISEGNVRSIFVFLSEIQTQGAIDLLLENGASDILDIFMDYQRAVLFDLKDKEISGIYLKYFKENSAKLTEFTRFIESLDIDRQIEILENFSKEQNFNQILNAIVKSKDPSLRIIALYHIYKSKVNKKAHDKILFKVIKEENYEFFLDLVKENNIDIGLISEILDLDKIKPKRISLDDKKIARSRKALRSTVETISQFVGEEENIETTYDLPEKEEEPKEKNLSESSRNFLKLLIEKGPIGEDDARKIAQDQGLFLNIFIKQVNDELYDYINDQTVRLEDGNVLIDEFYLDMVEEYIR
ncbi:tellurite resistance TerB C-terminal domain-containing protein [uncultured Anaerococcus sp.]|uniref:tellurite resistance TerB C-terminal domain-containing protein n=1 Tax=uncultured Anaerococcus sp. TaxID=293428 RepID=UPI0025F4D049|nr:tellurite resistance TerB C-terminal domain-containing protein [uncultured Anaerococcus sp.]